MRLPALGVEIESREDEGLRRPNVMERSDMDSNKKATEINDAVPTSLSHLVGQKQVIAQVTTAMDAAFEDGTRFDHALLVGAPGLGKVAIGPRHRPGNGDRFPRSPRPVDHQTSAT